MSDPQGTGPLPVALKAQREKTIAALCEHFSADHLTMEEFEQRLDIAARAVTLSDLQILLADLPQQTTAPVAAPRPVVRTTHTRETQTMVAIMGGVERRGAWTPAKHTFVVALMGGGMLDFRDVQLPEGETEVTIFCIMGGMEVIVPPDMNVDTGGFAIMGGFAHRQDAPVASRDPNAPLLRINGFALMGGVDLQVRLPGETAGDARHREREQRRRLRNERRGR